MYPYNFNFDQAAEYTVETVDESTIKVIASTNNGDTVIKQTISKIQRLAEIEGLKETFNNQIANFTNQLNKLNDLKTSIEALDLEDPE